MRFIRLRSALMRRERYLKAAAVLLGDRVFAAFLSFVTFAVMARCYAPDDIGVWSYAQTVVQFAAPFLAAGAEAVIIREIVRRGRDSAVVLGSGAAVLFVTSIVVSLLPLAYLSIANPGESALFTLALLLTAANLPNAAFVIEHFFKAQVRPGYPVVARIVALSVSAGIKIWLSLGGAPITMIGIATAIEAFLIGGGLIWVYRRDGHSVRTWRYDGQEARTLFLRSFPAMVSAVVVFLFFRINHILLAQVADYAEVGRYAVAFSIVQLFGMLPWAVLSTLYPRMIALSTEDRARFDEFMAWEYWGFAALGYVILIVVALTATPVLGLFLSARYDGTATILLIMALSTVFSFMGAVRAQYINIFDAMHLHIWNSLVGLAVLVPISLLLIPQWGGAGAAWGVAAGTFTAGVLTTGLFKQTRQTAWPQFRALFLIPPRWR